MASPENVFRGTPENIETYLGSLEAQLGQLDKTVREIGELVRQFGAKMVQNLQKKLEEFNEKADLVRDEARLYSNELLALFPMIEDGIINLNGEERKVFLGFRGRYDVVRNDLTNIRRSLVEYYHELHQMGIN